MSPLEQAKFAKKFQLPLNPLPSTLPPQMASVETTSPQTQEQSSLEQAVNRLTASMHMLQMQQFQSQRVTGNAVLTEQFVEIFTSLVALKHITSLSQVLNITLPPSTSFTVNVPAPQAQVILITEALFTLAGDNQFSVNVIVDSESKYADASMLQARYNSNPLNFFSIGSLYPATAQLSVELANLSNSSPNTIGLWLVGGIIDRRLWNDLVQLYFRSLLTELGLSV